MARRLENCPPGLFLFEGAGGRCLGFKSEYRTEKHDETGQIIGTQTDAYVVASGEYFWGGVSGDWRARERLLVEPIDDEAVLAAMDRYFGAPARS